MVESYLHQVKQAGVEAALYAVKEVLKPKDALDHIENPHVIDNLTAIQHQAIKFRLLHKKGRGARIHSTCRAGYPSKKT